MASDQEVCAPKDSADQSSLEGNSLALNENENENYEKLSGSRSSLHPKQKAAIAVVVIAVCIIIMGCFLAFSIPGWKSPQSSPSPSNSGGTELQPREFPIEVDPSFKFTTQYGTFVETLEKLFAPMWTSGWIIVPDESDQHHRNPHGALDWTVSCVSRAMVYMYKTTRDLKYFWPLLNRTDETYRKDVAKLVRHTIVHSGIVLMPLVEVANLIKQNETLWQNASLRERAENYVRHSEAVVKNWTRTNWRDPGDGTGYFVIPPSNKYVTWNRNGVLGMVMLQISDFTGNKTYVEMMQKFARLFRKFMLLRTYHVPDDNFQSTREMYKWGYTWNRTNEDTGHGCLDIEFIVTCYERGFDAFSAEDMRLLSHTFVDFVYRGRASQTAKIVFDPFEKEKVNHTRLFSDFITGQVEDRNSHFVYLHLRQGWLELYRYHENVTISSFVVARSIADLILSMPTRPPYDKALSTRWMQGMAVLQYMIYANREPLERWF